MTELDREDRDELHYAARDNDVVKVRARLAAGADPSLRERGLFTPLHFAAQRGSVEAASVLLDAGADINAFTSTGDTALHIAVDCWDTAPDGAMIRLLLNRGADQNARANDGLTPADVIDQQWRFPDEIARLLR